MSTDKNTDKIGDNGEEPQKLFKDWREKTYSERG